MRTDPFAPGPCLAPLESEGLTNLSGEGLLGEVSHLNLDSGKARVERANSAEPLKDPFFPSRVLQLRVLSRG